MATKAEARVLGTELGFAVAEGLEHETRQLLEKRVDPNFRSCEQRTALHIACASGHGTAIIRLLLAFRADVNVFDHRGNTPLSDAEHGGFFDVEDLLLQSGAKLRQERLFSSALKERWAVDRKELKLREVLNETLKSKVWRATWRGTDVVVKLAKVTGVDIEVEEHDDTRVVKTPTKVRVERSRDEILHEIRILATIRHPDLVQFLGACLEEGAPIMFLTEFMPCGDLENFYENKRQAKGGLYIPTTSQMLRWASAVIRALCFLHNCSRPIIHRDLKPLNLLLTQADEVKVSDFGISKISAPNESSIGNYKMTGGVGSWLYMAPEVCRHKPYNEKVDIFSFALILYFISSGRRPFHEMGRDPELVLKEYSQGGEPRPQVKECPAFLRPIMIDAWHHIPEKRPSAHDLTDRLTELPATGGLGACCSTM